MNMLNIAIIGATGAVGKELRETLERRDFPVGMLRPLASERSAGKKIAFRGEEVTVELLTERSFEGIDLVLSSAGGSISKKFGYVIVTILKSPVTIPKSHEF